MSLEDLKKSAIALGKTDKVYLSLGSSSKSKTISKLFLSITALKGIEIESLFINLMYSVLILSKGMLLNILNFSSNSKLVFVDGVMIKESFSASLNFTV